MTVKEVYEQIGGSYDVAMSLMRKEERVKKYLGMFLQDESFAKLKNGMDSGNMQAAFIGAHTLKGVCGNLSFNRLRDLVSDLTEDLRNGTDIPHAKASFPAVAACYQDTVEKIRQFFEEA